MWYVVYLFMAGLKNQGPHYNFIFHNEQKARDFYFAARHIAGIVNVHLMSDNDEQTGKLMKVFNADDNSETHYNIL